MERNCRSDIRPVSSLLKRKKKQSRLFLIMYPIHVFLFVCHINSSIFVLLNILTVSVYKMSSALFFRFSKASILALSVFNIVHVSNPYKAIRHTRLSICAFLMFISLTELVIYFLLTTLCVAFPILDVLCLFAFFHHFRIYSPNKYNCEPSSIVYR